MEAFIQAFADKPDTTNAEARHLNLLRAQTRAIARGDQALANRFRRPGSLTVVSVPWLSGEPRTHRGASCRRRTFAGCWPERSDGAGLALVDDGYDVLIVAEAIPFHSLCMHHLTTDFR